MQIYINININFRTSISYISVNNCNIRHIRIEYLFTKIYHVIRIHRITSSDITSSLLFHWQ